MISIFIKTDFSEWKAFFVGNPSTHFFNIWTCHQIYIHNSILLNIQIMTKNFQVGNFYLVFLEWPEKFLGTFYFSKA